MTNRRVFGSRPIYLVNLSQAYHVHANVQLSTTAYTKIVSYQTSEMASQSTTDCPWIKATNLCFSIKSL